MFVCNSKLNNKKGGNHLISALFIISFRSNYLINVTFPVLEILLPELQKPSTAHTYTP